MAYCLRTDLENELRNFSQLVPTGKDIDAWATHMIKKADSYIDMRLNRKYSAYIPFDNTAKCPGGVPEAIWMISVQLSIFYCLFSNYAGQSAEKVEAIVTSVYKPAVDMLNWISKGNLEIPELDGTTDNLLIDSTTDDYRREFRLSRQDDAGNSIIDGNMDTDVEGDW